MHEIRQQLKEGWEKLRPQDRRMYKKAAQADNSVCFQCKSKCPQSQKKNIDWVSCDICSKWYHTDCVFITKEYANSVLTYSCPHCVKGFEKGSLNFLFHFRFDTLTATGEGYNKIFRKWKTLNNTDKQVVRIFSYTMLSTSPLLFRNIYKFFPDRGIMNPYNNCWANAVLQVICGSAVSHYLPRVNECPTPLWNV